MDYGKASLVSKKSCIGFQV